MKRFAILLLLTVLLPLDVAAQVYFCTAEGTELTYRRTLVKDGSTKWIDKWTIGQSVALADGGKRVNYSAFQCDAKGRSKMRRPASVYVDITAEGDVLMAPHKTLRQVAKTVLPKADITAEGALTRLPSSMKPGDRLPDASSRLQYAGLSYTANVTDRKVLRRETISTPAGSFDCIVVSEHKVEKAPGYNRVTTALTWYCDGLGMVRHDTCDKDGKLETSEVLEKIVRR